MGSSVTFSAANDNNVYVFCELSLPLTFWTHSDECIQSENIKFGAAALLDKLHSIYSYFLSPCGNYLLTATSVRSLTDKDCTHEELTCGDLITKVEEFYPGCVFIPMKFVLHQTVVGVCDSVPVLKPTVPIIKIVQEHSEQVTILLQISVVETVSREKALDTLYKQMLHSIEAQCQEMTELLLKHTHGSRVYIPEPFHFLLPGDDQRLVTVIYPHGLSEEELSGERHRLHKKYNIPTDKPYFRQSMAVSLHKTGCGVLQNVPVADPAGPDDLIVYKVAGTYSYYHYNQDAVCDEGWGCAYRSLQTLVSWFIHQGYLSASIPSHSDIQAALVAVGDKEPSFVGSRQWIGSLEVSYVLDHLFGITSKILFVNSGSELSSKAREIAQHFQGQGTPIMIGGGVLAHTILGVALNETTGKTNFLILDPHYKGNDELKAVIHGGWCAWKDENFWNQTVHYNLCLPQRPICL